MKGKLAIWLMLTLSACSGGGSGGTALAPGPAAVNFGAANSDTLIVELINQIYDLNNMLVQTDKTDYAVTASGAISFVSATAQEGADSLVVTAN